MRRSSKNSRASSNAAAVTRHLEARLPTRHERMIHTPWESHVSFSCLYFFLLLPGTSPGWPNRSHGPIFYAAQFASHSPSLGVQVFVLVCDLICFSITNAGNEPITRHHGRAKGSPLGLTHTYIIVIVHGLTDLLLFYGLEMILLATDIMRLDTATRPTYLFIPQVWAIRGVGGARFPTHTQHTGTFCGLDCR